MYSCAWCGNVYSATDLGPLWSNLWLSAWYGALGSGRVRIPFPQGAETLVGLLPDLIADGQLRGVFDRSYPFQDIVTAYR